MLAILALFTHNNMFWVAALLLSVVRLPEFHSPLKSIAAFLERLSMKDTAADPITRGEEPPVVARVESDPDLPPAREL